MPVGVDVHAAHLGADLGDNFGDGGFDLIDGDPDGAGIDLGDERVGDAEEQRQIGPRPDGEPLRTERVVDITAHGRDADDAHPGVTERRALFEDQINKSGHTAQEKANMIELLRHMHDTNIFGHEAGMEMQHLANPTGNIASRALDRADLISRQMGQAIEAINRAVVGLSEYQLEYKKNGGNHTAAMARARMVVHDTMGNYSASNAAPITASRFRALSDASAAVSTW